MKNVIPYEVWMRSALRPKIDEVLLDQRIVRDTGLQPAVVGDVWRQFLQHNKAVNMQHPLALYILIRWCAKHKVRL